MTESPHIRPLEESDEVVVRTWLAAWLEDHLASWVPAYGLSWSRNDIQAHLAAHDLVGRDWRELSAATSGDAQRLVRLAVSGGNAVGIVHIERRQDRYLALPVGAISWLYVAPDSRRRGIAKQLLIVARDWMKAQGMVASEVFVTAASAGAVSAYIQAGHVVLDHRMVSAVIPSGRGS